MSTVPTQLVMADRTVTSHHSVNIRQHTTSTPLLQHIARKNNWTEEVISLVDWNLHSAIVKKHTTPCMSKYLHQCLPVQSTLFRRNQSASPICLRCHQIDEGDNHIITCTHSNEWRSSLHNYYKSMATKHNTNVQCVEFIIQALELHNMNKQIDLSTLPHEFRQDFQHQQRIGWSNWYKGRIALLFCPLFPKGEQKFDYLKVILNHTLTQWKELWIERNAIVHGHHNNSKQSEKTLRVHAELEHIYKRKSQYLNKDQEILFDNIEQHKILPISSIQNWLLLYKHHLIESAQLAKKYSLIGVSKITKYFKIT